MSKRSPAFFFALLGIAALLIATSPAEAQKKRAEKNAEEAAKQQANFKEAEALRVAYIMVAVADHDYDGHRVKAMKQLQEAVKLLDIKVLRHGTAAQKDATIKEDEVDALAKEAAKHTPKLHEGQNMSDAQMKYAGELLLKVRGALVESKHPKVLNHVNEAIKQIDIALKIR
jgi:hypothetical protein